MSNFVPFTVTKCSNCNKELTRPDREACERINSTECSNCRWHELNGTRKIGEYNKWLRKG